MPQEDKEKRDLAIIFQGHLSIGHACLGGCDVVLLCRMTSVFFMPVRPPALGALVPNPVTAMIFRVTKRARSFCWEKEQKMKALSAFRLPPPSLSLL
jgi:hypothetical protein